MSCGHKLTNRILLTGGEGADETVATIECQDCDAWRWQYADGSLSPWRQPARPPDPHRSKAGEPVPIRLHCPLCGELHVDEGEFATKPHHTHACQHCGHVWRPAVVPTVGVRFLPGFKDPEPEE